MTRTGDIVWGDFRPGFFDPAPLPRLAEYMRDGRWLVLQTEDGPLARVRITEIRVYVQGEDVVLRQEWLDERGDFQHRQIVIDSESIWKANPIKMSVSDVPAPVGASAADAAAVFGHIVNVLIADTGFTTGQLTASANGGRQDRSLSDARHSGIVLLYEMTDLEPLACCEQFGYKSPTPFHNARWKMDVGMHQSQREIDFRNATKQRARKVWTRLGRPARRHHGGGMI